MNPRALIFDVDGTLAETEEAHRQAFNETFAASGLDWSWSVDDYRDLLRTTGGKERMRQHRENIRALAPGDEEIAALHRRKTARYTEIVAAGGLGLRPGVEALITAARAAGIRLAIATTTSRANVDVLIEACLGLSADVLFDVIAAGDEVAAKKPAPDVFLLALQRLGLPASDCIAFEDSRNGLVSAKGAGLKVVVTPSVYTAAETFAESDWQVPDLTGENLPPELVFSG